ncbi:MAG: bifunctional hydroxymethylpyrimidine kinase/phosphomethylpyrimidine kinase [Myxococcaceae bacterium]
MNAPDPRPVCALTIAGSDSGGGAGIQADLKTFAAHGVHGLSALAALTAQHTRGVAAVHVPPLDFLRAQIDACFADFRVHVVKLGMLASAEVIHAVADALEHHRPAALVLDPVMVATSGARLLEENALQALRTRLIPLASVTTPNIPEAEQLLGHPIPDGESAESAVGELLSLGARAVLLKGGHLPGTDEVVDRLCLGDRNHVSRFVHPRLDVNGHGTGCTLASAIAAQLCLGRPLPDACAEASDYVHGALVHAYRPGSSNVSVLEHFWRHKASAARDPERQAS